MRKTNFTRLAWMTGAALATMAVATTSAGATSITRHYFLTEVGIRWADAAGHPVRPHKRPHVGDVADQFSLAYVGSHTHHAKQWAASFHMRCVFRRSTQASCDAQIAIGGSMLLANGFHLNFPNTPKPIPITGGTGVFYGAHGTVTAVVVSGTNNSDVTIRARW